MNVKDVPQDERYFINTNIRDICYAVDEAGKYRQVASVGWEAKNEALALTWEHINEEAEAIKKEVLAQKRSPLAYYMHLRLCSVGLLAGYTGISRRIIKKHLHPDAFKNAGHDYWAKYAQALNIEPGDFILEKMSDENSI